MAVMGRFAVDTFQAATFLVMSALCLLATLLAPTPSLASLAYLLCLYPLYALRLGHPAGQIFALDAFQKMMAATGLLGMVQFGAQFAVGPELAFPLDTYVPKAFLLEGYNVVAPIEYGVNIMRSNGVVFLEPSFFSQFLALAIVIELLGPRRATYFAIFSGALLASYSGTGPLVLAVMVPVILWRQGNIRAAGALAVAVPTVLAASTLLNLDSLVGRFSEFDTPQSSGFARFVSPFLLMRDFLFDSPLSLLFGHGPGSIVGVMGKVPLNAYLAHDPSWAKAVFEYGLVGGGALLGFVGTALCAHSRLPLLSVCVLLVFLFLGGYLLNPTMHLAFLALLAWHNQPQTYPSAPTLVRRAGTGRVEPSAAPPRPSRAIAGGVRRYHWQDRSEGPAR